MSQTDEGRQWPIPPTISQAAANALRAQLDIAYPEVPEDPRAWAELVDMMRSGVQAGLENSDRGLRVPVVDVTYAVAQVPVLRCTPDGAVSPAVVLYLHGGGFVLGGGESCRLMGRQVAAGMGATAHAVDYRLAPEHPYPAALDDATTVYRDLLRHHPANRIVVCGHSAGAALAASLVVRLRDEQVELPGGLILLSPEADLTEEGDSFELMGRVPFLTEFIREYAGGQDLKTPELSPVHGDLRGFPPTLLQTGTRDLFLSNTVRMHRALRAVGVQATLHVWEAMPHVGFGGNCPEDDEVYAETRDFRFAGDGGCGCQLKCLRSR